MTSQTLAIQLLDRHGPMTSTALSDLLQTTKKISSVAARQQISRLKPPVMRLADLNFQRAKFLYLQKQYRTLIFKQKLEAALIDERTAFARPLLGLRRVGGSCFPNELPVLAASPIQNRKGHLSFNRVIATLDMAGLLELDRDSGAYRIYDEYRRPHHLMLSEIRNYCLAIARTWAIRTNLSSSNTVSLTNDGGIAEFGGFAWDLKAPSYLAPLRSGAKPGFVVADVLINESLSRVGLDAVQSVFHKAQAIQAQKGSRDFIPCVIHVGLERDALDFLRSKGFMILHLDTLGDTGLHSTLIQLIQAFDNAIGLLKRDPDEIWNIYKKLDKAYGNSLNLNGSLFTFINAYIAAKAGASVDLNEVVISKEGQRAEIDVKTFKNKVITATECKGFMEGNTITLSDIQFWVENRLPRINSWFNHSRRSDETLEHRFVISTRYTPEVREYCDTIEKLHRRHPIKFLDGLFIEQALKDQCDAGALQLFRTHFSQGTTRTQ